MPPPPKRNRHRLGVSKAVTVITGRHLKPANISVHMRKPHVKLQQQKQRDILASMTTSARLRVIGQPEPHFDYGNDTSIYMADPDDDDNWLDEEDVLLDRTNHHLSNLAPGDEAAYESGAGGETSIIAQAESLVQRRKDTRTRNERVQKLVDAWRGQMGDLENALLAFRAHGPPIPDAEGTTFETDIRCWKGFTTQTRFPDQTSSGAGYNVTLLRHGFLGTAPSRPTLAISVHTLAMFRQINRVCPRLSDDAFCEALQHYHQVPIHPHLAVQFRVAYDCYVELERRIDERIRVAMKQSTRQDYLRALCCLCSYMLLAEIVLFPAKLFSMDGNSSLKNMDSSYRAGSDRLDNREVSSHRWISEPQVDVFKDEVKRRDKKKSPSDTHTPFAPTQTPPSKRLDGDKLEGLDDCMQACVDKWKAASPDSQKKMYDIFAVAGVFITVCRHGHVHAICDMVRSGELMKYPLSMIEKLIDDHGEDVKVGYDIFCAFVKTLQSSCLGEKVVKFNLTGVVPAFHGWAHSRDCQLEWHPLYMDGVGIEDFEESERVFSRSNDLAPTTRLSTRYHRRIQIEEHFDFHDEDKHARSGLFLFNNYKQALDTIEAGLPDLERRLTDLSITRSDLDGYVREEREYFQKRKVTESEEDEFRGDYHALLTKYWTLQGKYEDANRAHSNYGKTGHGPALAAEEDRLRRKCRALLKDMETAEGILLTFEDHHRVPREDRWFPGSVQYREAQDLLIHRKYRQLLEDLERSLLMRYQELTRIQAGIGYKQRMKLTNALRTRAGAIAKLLNKYNEIAPLLKRPKLSWNDLTLLVSTSGFDLLRDPSGNVNHYKWAQPARRAAVTLYLKVKRAEEEIVRLNVESRRLWTFMADEHTDFVKAIDLASSTEPEFAHTLRQRANYRSLIHQDIVRRMKQMKALPGFSGCLELGQAAHRPPRVLADALPDWVGQDLGGTHLSASGSQADADTHAMFHVLEHLHLSSS